MLRLKKKKRWPYVSVMTQGQIIMEFVFSMMVLLIMLYGTMMVFRWTGIDLGFRRLSHDQMLNKPVNDSYNAPCDRTFGIPPFEICLDWGQATEGPIEQIDPYFYKVTPMNAIWDGS